MKFQKSQILIFFFGLIAVIAIVLFSVYIGEVTQKSYENNSAVNTESGKVFLPGDNDKIYSSIKPFSEDLEVIYPQITHDTVKEMLSAVSTPDVYYWYFNNTICSARKDRSVSGIMKYINGNYMIEIYSGEADSKLEKTIIDENGTVSVQTYENSQVSTSEFNSASTSAFTEAGVPQIEDFLSEKGESFDYSLHESDYGKLLYAEFISEKDGFSQTQQYYISLDFGIVIKAECYENNKLVYSLNTMSLYELENV